MVSMNDFRNELKTPYSPTQYKVEFALPESISSDASVANRQLSFLCKNAQMPGVNIGEIEIHHRNNVIPYPGDTTFDPWEATIIMSNDFIIRNAMEDWAKAIKNFDSTSGFTDFADITVPIKIIMLDKNDNELKSVTLENAFLQNITPVDLSYESKDTIAEFNITVRYSHWV